MFRHWESPDFFDLTLVEDNTSQRILQIHLISQGRILLYVGGLRTLPIILDLLPVHILRCWAKGRSFSQHSDLMFIDVHIRKVDGVKALGFDVRSCS